MFIYKNFLLQKKGANVSENTYLLLLMKSMYCNILLDNNVGCCQQTFEYKKFVDNAQQCFAFMPQANFPTYNLNSN